MSVYVDNMLAQYGNMKMCHMIADTLDELHAMADKIGVNRKWFQNNPDHPHYDISSGKVKLAIANGAIQVTTKQLTEIIRKKRDESRK